MSLEPPPPGPQRRPRALTVLAIVLGTLAAVAPVVGFVVTAPMTFGAIPYTAINPSQAGLLMGILSLAGACFAATLAAPRSTASRWTAPLRVLIVGLALIAPIVVVIGLRLMFRTCLILNPLGLPWPEPMRTAVHVLCLLVFLASTAGIVFGFVKRDLRPAAIVAAIYSALAVIPGFIVSFALVYGDPGPNCVVG